MNSCLNCKNEFVDSEGAFYYRDNTSEKVFICFGCRSRLLHLIDLHRLVFIHVPNWLYEIFIREGLNV